MEPDTLHDEVFGELVYDPPMEGWHARVALKPDHRIDVMIWWAVARDGPPAPILDRASAAFVRFCEQEPAHRRALADAMIERYRESARVEAELPDADTLANELSASEMWIETDGSATVHYADRSELFGDHSVMADLDADGSFDGFTLQG